MKTLLAICFTVLFVAGAANADVTGLSIKFGGGCYKGNTKGNCVIKVTAAGTELSGAGVQLYSSMSQKGPWKRYSNRVKELSATGLAQYKIRNIAGACFEVRTAKNGNDKPDITSRKLCEK